MIEPVPRIRVDPGGSGDTALKSIVTWLATFEEINCIANQAC